MQICQIFARIPLQSKIGSEAPIFASFPSGEAMGAVRYLNSSINSNLSFSLSIESVGATISRPPDL